MVVFWLVLLAPACAEAPAARRDEALQAALESARVACIVILSDKSIEREPGVDAYCEAIANGGCPKAAP
jgi:hypothetical protein